MNKEQAIEKLTQLEKETAELRKIIEAPDQSAKDWLLNFLSQEFTVKRTKGLITDYIGEQWIFQQDLKNKRLWCYYYKVWEVFKTDFGMEYQEIQALIKEVVGEALNCRDFTPDNDIAETIIEVGEALNYNE